MPLAVSDRREADGGRLDRFLCLRLHRYSRGAVRKLIEEGRVLRRGRALKASTKVYLDDVIVVRYPRREEEPARYQALPVLHEDAELLVVDKPGDLLSHPTDKVRANAATTVVHNQFPGRKLYLVHRLDRETSGVLLFAKSAAAARALAGQFERREVRKTYAALTRGEAAFKRKTVDLPIGREGGEIKVRQAVGAPGAVPCRTDLRVLGIGAGKSLIEAAPKTGRLHQIRVHLAAVGHPILGDKLYHGDGAEYLKAVENTLTSEDFDRLGARRQMLHARTLELAHPRTGRTMRFTAPLPTDFRNTLDIDIDTQDR